MTTNPDPTFCSHCGEAGWISERDGHPHCSQCGTTHWTNDRPVAVMLLRVYDPATRETNFLLTTTTDRNDDWAFPAGFVEKGEDAECAARRELREETGIDYRGSIRVEYTTSTKRGHLLVFCVAGQTVTLDQIKEQFTPTPEAKRWSISDSIDGFRHPLHHEAFGALADLGAV